MTLAELQHKAVAVVGAIQWNDSGVAGLCVCPGAIMHTGPSSLTDCTIFVEGAPTIFCFHTSCVTAVAAANLRLRRSLGAVSWALILPDGSFLRSGESRIPAGQPIPKPVVKDVTAIDAEKKVVRDIENQMAVLKERLLSTYSWDPSDMVNESPTQLNDSDVDWTDWLGLWEADDVVWVGSTYDSGQEYHKENFRTAREWLSVAQPPGQFTCGSAFKAGSFSRKNEHASRRFMVIESDTLSKREIGAVFQWLRKKLGYTMHCIVNTGGKSLHGWFELPPHPIFESRLKVALTVLGCDPALFKPSQPVRVPGAYREPGVKQSLLWLRSHQA